MRIIDENETEATIRLSRKEIDAIGDGLIAETKYYVDEEVDIELEFLGNLCVQINAVFFRMTEKNNVDTP